MSQNVQHANCLNCGADFDADSISRKQRFAQCTHCGALHNVSRFYTNDDAQCDLPVAMPFGVDYREGEETTELLVRPQSVALVSAISAGVILLSLLVLAHAALAFLFNPRGDTLWMKSGGAAVAMFTLGFLVNRRSFGATAATFGAGGLHWDYGWNLKRHVRHLELAEIKGFIATPVHKGVKLEVISADGLHHALVPGRCGEAYAGTVIHLAEHALRRARKMATAEAPAAAVPRPAPAPAATKRRCTVQVSAYRRARAASRPAVARLQCDGCGAPMTPGQIDRDERSATCNYCGLVRDASDFLNVPRPEQRKLMLPVYATIETTDTALELTSTPPDREAAEASTSAALTLYLVAMVGFTLLPLVAALIWESGYALLASVGVAVAACYGVTRAFRNVRQVPMTYIVRLSAAGLSRTSAPVEDQANFELMPGELHAFIPQAYDSGDGSLKYAVLAEDRDGNRFTIAADLMYAGAALAVVDRLDAARERFHPALT